MRVAAISPVLNTSDVPKLVKALNSDKTLDFTGVQWISREAAEMIAELAARRNLRIINASPLVERTLRTARARITRRYGRVIL